MSAANKLHPLSVIFVLQKNFLNVALVLLTGSAFGTDSVMGTVIIVSFGFSVVTALVQAITFSWRVDDADLHLSWGLINRTSRTIPLRSIQNIDEIRSPLHQLLGVADLYIDTASGAGSDANFRVLSLEAARELQSHVERHRGERDGLASPQVLAKPLYTMPVRDLVLLGVLSGRGFLLTLALLGTGAQMLAAGEGSRLERLTEIATAGSELVGLQFSRLDVAWILAVGLTLCLGIMMGLSVVMAVLRYHGFEIRGTPRELKIRFGALVTRSVTLPLKRMQSLILRQSVLETAFGLGSLSVVSAGGDLGAVGEASTRMKLIPLGRACRLRALGETLHPGADFSGDGWIPVGRTAARRLCVRRSIPVAGVLGALPWLSPVDWPLWWSVAVLFLWVVMVWWMARYSAAAMGCRLTPEAFQVRLGRFRRRWVMVPFEKIQSLNIQQSPFDRRHRHALIEIDIAGRTGRPVHLPYLPEESAAHLRSELVRRASREKFVW